MDHGKQIQNIRILSIYSFRNPIHFKILGYIYIYKYNEWVSKGVCVYIYNIGIGISSKTQLFFHGKPQSCIFVNSLGTSTAFTRSQNPLRNPTEMLWICPSWVFSFGKARSLDVPKPFRCSDLAGNSSTVKSCFPDEP